MEEPIIKAEGISKKYIIGQRNKSGAIEGGFPTLRDRITDSARRFWQRTTAAATGRKATRLRPEEFWALQDISFEIQKGDRIGFIGRNGAGKSTLLKLLSRITEPTQGRITLNGRVASLLEVGTGFHPELTGRENVFLNGAILGMSRAEIKKKFDEIVAFAEVEKFLDTPVKRYSSGMYVRLAFSVAAHLEPEILIVDEVLAVGDVAFQKKCLGKMEDVSEDEGRTVLFVSHNMETIRRLCNRCILLDEGRIAADGEVSATIDQYLAHYAAHGIPNRWISLQKTRREGTGEARFAALKYCSPNSQTAYAPYSNGPLEFAMVIKSAADLSIKSLAVTIYSQAGLKLVNADTVAVGQRVELRKGDNQFKLTIENLPLNAGNYVLGLWMDKTGDSQSGREALDFIESAFSFEVVHERPEQFQKLPLGLVNCPFKLQNTSNKDLFNLS